MSWLFFLQVKFKILIKLFVTYLETIPYTWHPCKILVKSSRGWISMATNIILKTLDAMSYYEKEKFVWMKYYIIKLALYRRKRHGLIIKKNIRIFKLKYSTARKILLQQFKFHYKADKLNFVETASSGIFIPFELNVYQFRKCVIPLKRFVGIE